jgi:hypothetical protein
MVIWAYLQSKSNLKKVIYFIISKIRISSKKIQLFRK